MFNQKRDDFIQIDKKLSLSFGLVILFVLLSVLLATVGYFNYITLKEQNRFGSVIANGIGTAINSVSFSGKYQARLLIESLKKQNENIDSIIIQDGTGLVIGHSNPKYNGTYINDAIFNMAKQVMETNIFLIHNINVKRDDKIHNLMEIDIPYQKGFEKQIVGVIRVLISSDSYDNLREHGFIYLIGLILFLVFISYFFIRNISDFFSKPIKNLALQLDGILQYAPLSIHITNNKGEIVSSSEMFTKIKDNLLTSDQDEQYEKLVFETREIYKYQFAMIIDGHERHYNAIKCPIAVDPYGNVTLISTIIMDVTEQFLILKENEIQAIRLESLLNSIPDLVWMKDEDGVYLHCNKRFEQFFGATQEEIVGKTDYDFVDKKLADFFRENDLHAMNANEPVKNFEEITFASDGHKEYLETIKTAVRDQNQHIIGILGVGRDITTIKEQTEKLSIQKEEFETIFRNSKDGIAIVDLDMRLLDFNNAYLEMTGFTKEELLQKTCLDLTAPEDKKISEKVFNVVKEKGFVENYEKSCVTKDHTMVLVNMSMAMMPDQKRILISMKNMTQLKLMEQQSKLASMGEMIGNIAHQWRQPLSVISTLTSNLEVKISYGQSITEEDILRCTGTVLKQTDYLSRTIDDFRNFIKNDKVLKQISIRSVVEKTLVIISPTMKNNYINIVTDLKDDLVIEGFENELIQAFINILNNAKDAIRDNADNKDFGYIFISTKDKDNNLELTIKDTGGGIKPDIFHKVFEPYFTTKHQSVGTGIGLSMVYKIITQRHHATIEAQNVEYDYEGKSLKGAAFIINFSKHPVEA